MNSHIHSYVFLTLRTELFYTLTIQQNAKASPIYIATGEALERKGSRMIDALARQLSILPYWRTRLSTKFSRQSLPL
jgi:hypothetical protein